EINFDEQFIENQEEITIEIKNFGQQDLVIEEINLNSDAFTFDFDGSFSIGFNEMRELTVYFEIDVAASYEDQLEIISNDLNSPFIINISGVAVYPAIINTPTTELIQNLTVDTISESNILLQNLGQGTLNYNINLLYPDNNRGSQVMNPTNLSLQKDDVQEGKGFAPSRDSGGPDDFGYSWVDSDDENGPEFIWNDISGIGEVVNFYNDDQMSSSKNLGFEIDFYGNTYSDIKICSNGFLTFTSDETNWQNGSIPSASEPNNMIAPFWDDLSPQNSGNVFYYADENSFIVQFDNVPHYSGQYDGIYTFQAIIQSNGNITYMYNEMVGDIDSATIGTENSNGNDGLQIVYNNSYIHDELAIKISKSPEWIRCPEPNGTIEPLGFSPIVFEFDTNELEFDSYSCQIEILSNDPVNPQLIIPVTLNVTDENFYLIDFEILDTAEVEIGGASIVLINQDENPDHIYSTVSDNNGEASLNVVQGTYSINVAVDGYEEYTQTDVSIASDNSFSIELETVGNGEDGTELIATKLHNNHPNPFNPRTYISFSIAKKTNVSIDIFNIKGQKVKQLVY
ncbi:MAG: carboxypeptidase regulatory-like domain-containing protein, partial [Candidatus Cloacimonadota bacterium]|nr:carboxypeptidase regulatory-like domain-containing protein [Candidatus Cloacimonadota bacterium]